MGGRIVAENRAMGASAGSIVGDPAWWMTLGPNGQTPRLVDLPIVASDGDPAPLTPTDSPGRRGDPVPAPPRRTS